MTAPKIFISYRRDDSIAITGRIYDRLVDAFGSEQVFQDVIAIPPGVDFRKYIQSEIAKCDVLLVIIGKVWVKIEDEQGRKRLHNPADFVRLEVESALQQNKWVIPILVDHATMPSPDELPDSLQDFGYLNAVSIRHNPDFNNDIKKLIEALRSQQRSPHEQVMEWLPPPFDWCEISGGTVLLNDETSYHAPVKNGGRYTIAPFVISKYPITKAQYQVFVKSPDGYHNPRWWDTLQPPNPYLKMGEGNLPCTDINWYEAVAFCRWLTDKVGITIQLPTELQWQRAALGDTEWAYPWGNIFNESRCNFTINQLTPVDQYISGASPFGVMDMVGNVWEWCLSSWNKDEMRVLKGGSWPQFKPNLMRAEVRIWIEGSERLHDSGFRCVYNVNE